MENIFLYFDDCKIVCSGGILNGESDTLDWTVVKVNTSDVKASLMNYFELYSSNFIMLQEFF